MLNERICADKVVMFLKTLSSDKSFPKWRHLFMNSRNSKLLLNSLQDHKDLIICKKQKQLIGHCETFARMWDSVFYADNTLSNSQVKVVYEYYSQEKQERVFTERIIETVMFLGER